ELGNLGFNEVLQQARELIEPKARISFPLTKKYDVESISGKKVLIKDIDAYKNQIIANIKENITLLEALEEQLKDTIDEIGKLYHAAIDQVDEIFKINENFLKNTKLSQQF
ncbi:hypothetical protein CKF54_06945, partial [Psittacicella hinzii]